MITLAVVCLLVFAMVMTPWLIGEERQPITPGVAVASMAFNGLIIWLLLTG